MADVHKPKVEFFDVAARTNTDPKGFVRAVDVYRTEPWGLYMARKSDHHAFYYLESWIIPSLGLRASIFHYHDAHRRDQDYYVDIGEFTTGAVWKSVDHYLDLVVRTGREVELLDVDELIDARVARLITTADAHRAIEQAFRTADGIARHGYDLGAWLAAEGMPISWAPTVSAQPT